MLAPGTDLSIIFGVALDDRILAPLITNFANVGCFS